MNNKQIAYLTTNKLLKSNHKNKLCHSKLAGAAWEDFNLPELATHVPFSLILLRFSKSGTQLSTSMATCASFKIKNVAEYLSLIRCLSWVVLRVLQVTKNMDEPQQILFVLQKNKSPKSMFLKDKITGELLSLSDQTWRLGPEVPENITLSSSHLKILPDQKVGNCKYEKRF